MVGYPTVTDSAATAKRPVVQSAERPSDFGSFRYEPKSGRGDSLAEIGAREGENLSRALYRLRSWEAAFMNWAFGPKGYIWPTTHRWKP